MPNWVTNELTITGPKELLAEVGARLRAPIPRRLEDGTDVMTETEFSFWNIVKPDEEAMKEYHSKCDSEGMRLRNNWYNWNNRNWGCKWDVNPGSSEVTEDRLFYSFDTAWAPPLEVLSALAEQYPELEVSLRYVEEQGWGGVTQFSGTQVTEEEEWNIPETHEEAVHAFGECWRCNDPGSLYQDCPEAQKSTSHATDEELLGECRWCAINEDGRYDDCPEE